MYERSRFWSSAFILVCLSVTPVGCAGPTKVPMSSQEISVVPSTRVSPLSLEPVPIRPGPLSSLGAERPLTAPAVFSQLYGSANQQSHGMVNLPAGPLAVSREIELFPETETRGLLATRNRVLVLGRVWQLYDRSGRRLQHALSGPGAVVFDESGEAVLAIDATSALRRYSAETGQLDFRVGAGRGGTIAYTFVGAYGSTYLLAGPERSLDPHGRTPPRTSYLQMFKAAAPYLLDDDHLLQATQDEQDWELPGAVLVAAAQPSGCVFARRDQLFFTDPALSGLRAFSGAFVPKALSVDSRGTSHLLVETERGARYWRVEASGALSVNFPLPAPIGLAPVPPIFTVDGRTILQLEHRIVVLDTEGNPVASIAVASSAARWVAQPDGTGLLTDGGSLLRFGADLKSELLFTLASGSFAGPALALDERTVAVATSTSLLFLEARK